MKIATSLVNLATEQYNSIVTGGASIGARIRELRLKVGFQAQELAQRVGLDKSALSLIENDKRAVKTHELAAIADALRVSPLAILDPDSLLARLPVSPRTDVGAVLDDSVQLRLVGLAELNQLLTESGVTTLRVPIEPPAVDVQQWLRSAGDLATWARNQLKDEPVGDARMSLLIDRLESQWGIDVLVEERAAQSSYGAAITDPSFPLIFVEGSQQPGRALFSLLHEAAHVLLRDGDAMVLDADLVPDSDRERLANAFAASFILPEVEVRRGLSGREPAPLALCRILTKWGASFETLVFRLHNLRIIDARGRDALRSLGLRGLVQQLDDVELASRLLARIAAKPPRHAPGPLAFRALTAYRKGIISVRPLAGLYGAEPESFRAIMDRDAVATLSDAIRSDADWEPDEEIYQGLPV